MSEAGHPFRTEDLDDLRSRQRRDLRMVEPWIVARVGELALKNPVVSAVEDGALVEEALRDLAAELYPAIAELLTSMHARQQAERLSNFLDRQPDPFSSLHDLFRT